MVGVDLSAVILEEANKSRPHLYNERRAGDITQIFRELKPINLCIAGDSYIYFGDLHPLFASMEDGLANGGYAAFTLENVDFENEELQVNRVVGRSFIVLLSPYDLAFVSGLLIIGCPSQSPIGDGS